MRKDILWQKYAINMRLNIRTKNNCSAQSLHKKTFTRWFLKICIHHN